MVSIETERLILRDHKADDLASHHDLISNETAMYYLPEIRTKTLAESEENLKMTMKNIDSPKRDHVHLRIEDKETGSHVGEIGYTVSYEDEKRIANAGYFLAQKFWNKGYATEALKGIIRFAFEEDQVAEVQTGCLAENAASEKVMLKCGFKHPSYLPSHTVHDGKPKDRVEYSLTKEEYRN